MGKAVAIHNMQDNRTPENQQPGHEQGKQEEYFRLLADTTSAAIFIVTGQTIRYANLSARLITGYSPEELLEMKFWQLAHPSYQAIIKKYGVSNQWGGSNGPEALFPSRYELKLLDKKGEERWVDITAGRLSSEREPTWIVTAFDITERDLAEKELRKAKTELEQRVEQRTAELNTANQRLRAELEERERAAREREKLLKEIHEEHRHAEKARKLAEEAAAEAEQRANELDGVINSMIDAVIIYNTEGTILRANPAAIKAYGFNPAGSSIEDLSRKLSARKLDGSKLVKEDLPSTQALRGEIVYGESYIFTDNQGKELVIQASAAPLFNRGKLVGAVTSWHDVTEREHLYNENRSQRELLETILNTDPGGIAVLAGEDLVYRLINPAYRPLLPNPESDPIGKRYEEIWSSEERGKAADLIRNVLRAGQALRLDHHERHYPDGSSRFYSYHLQRMFWEGQPAVLTVLWETTAIDQARLAAQKHAEKSSILANISQALAEAGLDQETVLRTIVEQLAGKIGDLCIIRLLGEDGTSLIPVAYHSNSPEILAGLKEIYTGLKEGKEIGLAGKVLKTGEALHISQPAAKELKSIFGPKYATLIDRYPVSDTFYTPLKAFGQISGVLGMIRFQPKLGYSPDDIDFIQDVSERAALAIDNARLYAQEARRAIELEGLHREVQRLAQTDILTNSYNRRGFFELGEREVERFHRFGHPLSAMMLDVDGFKALNDTYGHAFGDLILQTLAAVCQRTIRQTDIIGRYGGDEFGILLPESDSQRAEKLAERLHRAVSGTTVDSPGGPISLSISIGVTESLPETRNLSELLARADAALYAAKQNGRNQVKRA